MAKSTLCPSLHCTKKEASACCHAKKPTGRAQHPHRRRDVVVGFSSSRWWTTSVFTNGNTSSRISISDMSRVCSFTYVKLKSLAASNIRMVPRSWVPSWSPILSQAYFYSEAVVACLVLDPLLCCALFMNARRAQDTEMIYGGGHLASGSQRFAQRSTTSGNARGSHTSFRKTAAAVVQ